MNSDDPLPLSLEQKVDEVCTRFEAAWKAGGRPRVEDYLVDLGGTEKRKVLRELILLDVFYRRQRGESCQTGDYQTRFPELTADWLTNALLADTVRNPNREFAETALFANNHRGDSPAGRRPEHVRVALVAGSGSVAPDDLYQLLLRRLRVSTLIAAVGLGVFFGFNLLRLLDHIRSGRIPQPEVYSTTLRVIFFWGVPAIVAAVSALLLWRRPPSSVRGLRLIEVIVVLVFAAILIVSGILGYQLLLKNPVGEAPFFGREIAGWYVYSCTLHWFCLIVWYGTMIPNTWRRSATVVGVLALTPVLLFAAEALWLRPLSAEHDIGGMLFTQAIFMGMAAAIAIFSSSRIEILRRRAAEARKLGQYVLKEKLGAGGMGEVYRAEHVLLRRPCALKVIRPERTGDPRNLRRFEREVQVTATLTHPNTVQIFDYGHAEDGTFYYVMEFLPGLTLEELVKREGPLPPSRAVHFLRQICAALREAHGHGLIHRDVKPGNVMICERGGVHDVVKLLDFGLVLPPVNDPDGEKLTQDGTITGTPAYLSPEQAGGQETLDARSDIYSVGALAYFLLTGKPPFADRSAVKILAAHLYEEPPQLSVQRSDLPADLTVVIHRCLAKMPDARFPDAASLDDALAGCRTRGG